MKNVLRACGIIALVAVIGFSMAACDFLFDDYDDDNSGSTTTSGQLTINGLSSVNGLYAYATCQELSDYILIAAESYSYPIARTLPKISGGSVTLKVWKTGGAGGAAGYSGNDKDLEFSVAIYDSPEYGKGKNKAVGHVIVDFSGGKATGTIPNLVTF